MFPIRCATDVELRLQQMGNFYEKNAFYNGKFKISGAVEWGLKIFAPNYQKAHPYAKSVVVTLYWHYTAARKIVRENRHWKLDVVYNTTSLPRRRDK